MKCILCFVLLIINATAYSQQAENLVIITIDGLRWQEVFGGLDTSIAGNKKYNQGDSADIFGRYWAPDRRESRKKIMPFLWSTVNDQGQLYGNRLLGNKVNCANPYWFSYPGYNEIFTGYADTLVNSNAYPPNPNTNLLEFLNRQPAFRGKVAAFGAWEAFDRILNEGRSSFPVFSAFDITGGPSPDKSNQLINALRKDSYRPFGDAECLDVFTHYAALDHLKKNNPKVLFIGYGETDEWAHSGHYKDYLDAAHMADKWIGDLWNYVQGNPLYSNKTVFFITTDHGRGDAVKDEWTSHYDKIKGANQVWFAVMGPGIPAKGEMNSNSQLFQRQYAQTMASLLGFNFSCEHPVGDKISLNQD